MTDALSLRRMVEHFCSAMRVEILDFGNAIVRKDFASATSFSNKLQSSFAFASIQAGLASGRYKTEDVIEIGSSFPLSKLILDAFVVVGGVLLAYSGSVVLGLIVIALGVCMIGKHIHAFHENIWEFIKQKTSSIF